MYRLTTNHPFNAHLSITLLCLAILGVSCSKTGQPSNNSTASAPSTGSSSGGDFEGMITMKMETEVQKGMEMTYFLKGRHTRIETNVPSAPEAHVVMLWDLEGAKITTLMPSRKTYTTMDLKEEAEGMKEAAKQMKNSPAQEEKTKFPKLTQTGTHETIAGYTCEHWLMGDKQDIDMCVAKGIGYFGMGGQGGGGLGSLKSLAFSPKLLAEAATYPEWVKFLEGGAFPLKITALEDGKVKMNMEATKVERKSLDDALFVVPPDYKELNAGNITSGLGKPK
jgi:hypothetical protein